MLWKFAHSPLLSLVAALLVAPVAAAQNTAAELADPVVDRLHEQTVQFLEDVSLGREEIAFADLLTGSPLAQQTEAVQKLIDSAGTIESRYGEYQNFERIDARRIGRDLVLLKYLYKCEDFPVVWYFTFYRDFDSNDSMLDNDWITIGVRYDTELELLGF